jgi:hypothetical protein
LNDSERLYVEFNNDAANDPAYLPYRCEACGLTGNKPMTTLAQAEWLKRLAMHHSEPETRHPYLDNKDIDTLFYGNGNSSVPAQLGGMSVGISTMLQDAIAKQLLLLHKTDDKVNIDDFATRRVTYKSVLDKHTEGKWRVFNKIGWGPSETRGQTENVLLAYVCLPKTISGSEPFSSHAENIAFVIAAQVAVDGANEANLDAAGEKMQSLLDKALAQYFAR